MVALGAGLLGMTAASAAIIAGPGLGDGAFESLARVPRANAADFHGNGALAIRQGRDLYILDGDAPATRAFRPVERGAVVRGMTWSHDGRWLAYATDATLWIVGRGGAPPLRLRVAVTAGDTFTWSPRADVLCVAHATGESYRPSVDPRLGYPRPSRRPLFATGAVTLVEPNGRERRLPLRALPESLRWTSDGQTVSVYTYRAILPYAQWPRARFALYVVDAHNDHRTLRAQSVAGGQLAFAAPIPRSDSFLYWRGDVLSGSVAADGQALWLNSAPAAERGLGTMLTNPSWISFSRDGARFVFVAGAGREAWHTKSLVVCGRLAQGCRPLPQPAHSIAVDPRWSPRADRIAFVHGVDDGPAGGYGLRNLLVGWIGRRTLWLQNTDDGTSHPAAGFGSGVFWPEWSADGRRILVYRNGQLWIGAPGGAPPVRVIDGLARPAEFPDHFRFNHGMANDVDSPFAWTGK